MSSRFWLVLAFVAAFGPQPASAGASPETLTVMLDEAKIAKLPEGTWTLHRRQSDDRRRDDAQEQRCDGADRQGLRGDKPDRAQLGGAVILEKRVRVLPGRSVVVLQNGSSRVSYSCNPECMPTVQLGDDPKYFNETGGEIAARNGFAAGSAK